ncbi:transglutaminase-like domain-containing protein [Deinococcus apachensis]|uniref:transglutaminase-like domain-containing protein n=1 Tax=Deinococcus apachensis TaxID=309886 RepID=UPI000365828C|nr:transglutaminase-like domain-containing protein [Deinococcus apachensis]
MTTPQHIALDFFRRPKPHTDLGPYSVAFQDLPRDVPALCQIVRGLVLHPFDAHLFGVQLPPERDPQDGYHRGAQAKLHRILELDGRDLILPRSPELRLSAHCMNFAVLLAALLHHQGVPARVRSGFVMTGEQHYNHWITEYWRDDGARWVRVDVQMGPEQHRAGGVTYDAHDLGPEQFQTATEVWGRCRGGASDATLYGWDWSQPQSHGWPYLRGQVVHDLAAIHGIDSFPSSDRWGLIGVAEVSQDDLALLDCAATLANFGNDACGELRALYEGDSRLRAPELAPIRAG